MTQQIIGGKFIADYPDVTTGELKPAVGYKLHTYISGSTTDQTTYSDAALTAPNINPVTLDARGEASVFLTPGLTYTLVLKTPTGTVIWTRDGIIAAVSLADLSTSAVAGLIGFLYSATYAAGSIGKWLQDLALSAGATFIGYLQAGTSAVLRTVRDRLRDRVSVFDFMTAAQIADVRAFTYTLDVTAALNAAYTYAESIRATAYHPSGGYSITPATIFVDEDAGYDTYAAFLMKSNLHVYAEPGVVFKVANSVSTDASPKSMGIFCTNEVLSNISIRGIDFDMNGANNLISPLRPVTYRHYNQSPILVSGTPAGVAARIDGMVVEYCTFRNNPGVCNIVCAQSNTAATVLGKDWKINFNRFIDNGLDTNDHTGVFAWADDVEFIGNNYSQTNKFGAIGQTGGNTCYEVHGSRHRVIGNKFIDYIRGVWVSSNLTATEVNDTIITGNDFFTHFYGVDFFRQTAALSKPRNTLIKGNCFRFDGYTYSAPVPSTKNAVNVSPEYLVTDILVTGNTAFSTDTVVGSIFITVAPQVVAALQGHGNIVVTDNKTDGFVIGALIRSNATNGVGSIVLAGNQWGTPNSTASFPTTFGEFIDPAGLGIRSLEIRGNSVIDERGVTIADNGTYVQAGIIDDYYYSGCFAKPTAVVLYTESGTVTGRRFGDFEGISFTPVYRAGGTAFTVVNGTRSALYSIHGRNITANYSYTIGAADTIPGGALSVDLPVASGVSGMQYLGQSQFFDTSAGAFTFGFCEIDGTASVSSFYTTAGAAATAAAPVALATGDRISMQVSYKKA